MFVRVKNIKGRPYAYLVENEWTPWGSRQKVAKYLGKTHLLTRISEGMLELPEGLQQTIMQGVVQELQNHGFTKEGDLMVKEDVIVNFQEQTIRQKKQKSSARYERRLPLRSHFTASTCICTRGKTR